MGGGFGAITDWYIGPQRLRFPGHRRWRCGREPDRVTDTAARLLGHKDAHAVALGAPLDTCCEVHRIPDGRVLAAAWWSDVTPHDGAGVNPDTHARRYVRTAR